MSDQCSLKGPPLGLENLTASELMGLDAAKGTRERLIRVGMDLVYEYGYHNVGIDQFISAAGVTKTTFYNHFESKDDFLVAVIRMRDKMELSAFERMSLEIAGEEEPRKVLLAMFDVLDAWFNSPEFAGCMFVNAAIAFPNPNDPIHQAACEHPRHIRQRVLNYTRWLGVSDPDGLADGLALLMQGALAMRTAADNNDAAKTARTMAEQMIDCVLANKA